MTGPTPLRDACLVSLIGCLRSVAEDCPDLPGQTPPLQRLRNQIQVLRSQSTTLPPIPPSPPDLALDQALMLISTSQTLLATLREVAGPDAVGAELDRALAETLSSLSDGLGAVLRQQRAHRMHGLYVIIDPQVTNGRDPFEVANAAIRGGARVLQLRDKIRDKGDIMPLATALQQLCQSNDVDLIINDHVDLAAVLGCSGVHVGQSDLPVSQARRVISPQQVLGRSNHEIDELIRSQDMGADHVAFGAIYQTGTKGVGRPPQGVDQLRRAKEVTKVPLVAIGGINAENVGPVVEAGADAVCVTAAIGLAPEPEAAATRLVEVIREAGGRA